MSNAPINEPTKPGGPDAQTCYAGFTGRLLRRWDWWIYRRAFHTLRRMAIANPGFAYLMELQIHGWNDENPIEPWLKSATEIFHQAMVDHGKA